MIYGYIAAIFATIFWGFDTVVIRWLIAQGVDPFLIGTLRLFLGASFLAVAMSVYGLAKRKRGLPRIRYTKFFWLIVASLVGNFLLFHKGLEYTIASDAVLLEAFSPVMVLVIIMIFLPERIKHLLRHPDMPLKILQTVIIGSIGSSLILINQPSDLLTITNTKFLGDMIEFAAMFAWAIVLLAMHEYQKREGENILAATSHFLFFAGVLMSPFVPWSEVLQLTSTQWMWIFLLGFFSTGLAYALWHVASKKLDILPLITIFNLVSVFTVTTETLVLGLDLSWKLIIGGALILYAAMKAKMMNEEYKVVGE